MRLCRNVSANDYKDLKVGRITWQELNLEQEYIEYENKASLHAYRVYNGILKRCGDTVNDDTVRSCYNKSAMWQGWLDNPKEFVKWYLEHYYECGDEEMDVDKDLFGNGSNMYSPDTCCLVPHNVNILFTKDDAKRGLLPIGVCKLQKWFMAQCRNPFTNKYEYLGTYDTPEKAFRVYKKYKENIIKQVAKIEYKAGNITSKCYEAMMNYVVEITD